MNKSINPFQQLYFSDDTQSENNFVELFSENVLQSAISPVFQGGNVVLSGTQGCGKTMILSLLRPETRIAYYKKQKKFPVDPSMRDFISAGINLTHSRITDISQMTLGKGEQHDQSEMPHYFSDFFNYLVVSDLIRSVEIIQTHPQVFDSLLDASTPCIKKFVTLVCNQECWFGALDQVKTLEELKEYIKKRITTYRQWVNGNLDGNQLPKAIIQTKTTIGEPIAKVVEGLRDSGMIKEKTPILIRVDQIEELHRALGQRQQILLENFRKMINRLFAARDARVHYRAGTRPYGWSRDFLVVWGSDAILEERRDYILVDMGKDLFERGENNNRNGFKEFAVDTFQKRIKYFFSSVTREIPDNLSKPIFGSRPFSYQRIKHLDRNFPEDRINRALALNASTDNGQWSKKWRDFLHSLYKKEEKHNRNMINAVLAAAWGRQTGGGAGKKQHRESLPPQDEPWVKNKWWRKERLNQAVLQLSIRCQQRYMWWGLDDIISLSGGNITVFLHICHRIWDVFLKEQSSLPKNQQINLLGGNESIDEKIQCAGILLASNDWFNKLPEEPEGNKRQKFIEQLGLYLNTKMVNDLSMSYPGGNGISIVLRDYRSEEDHIRAIRQFLENMVDYGVLIKAEHTSKTKSGGRRIKFHPHPILCPRFQLPETRTKEPYYWTISELCDFAQKANIIPVKPQPQPMNQPTDGNHPMQPSLDWGD